MSDKEVMVPQDSEIVLSANEISVTQEKTPMEMMIEAKKAGFSIEEIKEMMDLQDRNDARVARQAFHKAVAAFKKDPPTVIKDKQNDQYGSTYVSIGNLVNTVNKHMGPFGLNARWDFSEQSNPIVIFCTCIISHELGHSEKVTLSGPLDTSGTKNLLQQRKSTRTYLRIETFESVTGMASEEGNYNDDGNSSGNKSPEVKRITDKQANNIRFLISENGVDMDIFLDWLKTVLVGATKIEDIPAADASKVIKRIKSSGQNND